MPGTVAVEIARPCDREDILSALAARGIEARPVDGGFEVPCGEDAARRCEEVVTELERWSAGAGLPFVALQREGRVFLRPPAG